MRCAAVVLSEVPKAPGRAIMHRLMRSYLYCAVAFFAIGLVQSAQPTAQTVTVPAPPPLVKVLTMPDFWGELAIWGSTGSDRAGHIFLGVASNDERSGSAHLFEFNPPDGSFTDRGNVVEELERLKLRRSGEIQMKIHSRIVQATDGFQYFASMDETGEEDDGSSPPTWGGHLWRRGSIGRWEHLAATPQALIAVATNGPYVYALGYFNHVLYQFNTNSARMTSVTVGATQGHVSRNFFVDDRGHAFVPRVTTNPDPVATLVEYDADLKELASYPLNEYFERTPAYSHGIVGISPDGGHGWYFTTGKGRLYHQEPEPRGASKLVDLGWMNGSGSTYPASLFRDAQTGALYSVAMPSNYGGTAFNWITRRQDGVTTVATFPYGSAPAFPSGALVYGSMTQDHEGRFYIVGTMNFKPLVLQVTPR